MYAFLGVTSATAGIYSHIVTDNVADQAASTLAASTYDSATAMPAVQTVGRTVAGTRVFAAVGAGADKILWCTVSGASVTGCATVTHLGSVGRPVTGFAFDDGGSTGILFWGNQVLLIRPSASPAPTFFGQGGTSYNGNILSMYKGAWVAGGTVVLATERSLGQIVRQVLRAQARPTRATVALPRLLPVPGARRADCTTAVARGFCDGGGGRQSTSSSLAANVPTFRPFLPPSHQQQHHQQQQ